MVHAVLTYDLHTTPPSYYGKLNVELKKLGYVKREEDTTWEATFEGTDVDASLATVKAEFDTAARLAGVPSYNLRAYGAPAKLKVVVAKK